MAYLLNLMHNFSLLAEFNIFGEKNVPFLIYTFFSSMLSQGSQEMLSQEINSNCALKRAEVNIISQFR